MIIKRVLWTNKEQDMAVVENMAAARYIFSQGYSL